LLHSDEVGIIDFKKPWNYLYFLSAERRSREAEMPPQAANTLWSGLLEKVRTFYQENPDADF